MLPIPKRYIWKEYHLSSEDDFLSLLYVWELSSATFPGKRMVFEWVEPGVPWGSEDFGGTGTITRYSITTNCTLKQMAHVAHIAKVRLPRYTRGVNFLAVENDMRKQEEMSRRRNKY